MPAYRTVFCKEFLHIFFFFSIRTPDIVCVDLLGCAFIGLLRVGFMNPCEINCWLEYVGPTEL